VEKRGWKEERRRERKCVSVWESKEEKKGGKKRYR